jgi:hypothetical protein
MFGTISGAPGYCCPTGGRFWERITTGLPSSSANTRADTQAERVTLDLAATPLQGTGIVYCFFDEASRIAVSLRQTP